MKSFCCMYTLREGGIASAWYTMGAELIWLLQILSDIQHAGREIQSSISEGVGKENMQEVSNVTMLILEAAAHCVLWLTAGVMLIGIYKDRAGLLLPWITTSAVMLTLLITEIVRSVALIPFQIKMSSDNLSAIFTFLIGLEVLLVNIYCILCVTSLHSQMLTSQTLKHEQSSNTVTYSEKEHQLMLGQGDSLTKQIYS